MSWLFFAILAPALWAITNIVDDNLIRRAYPSPYVAAAMSGLLSSIIALPALFFVEVHAVPPRIALLGLLAGALIVAAYVLYYRSLQHDTPSVTVAIWGLSPAFLPFAAYFLIGEVLSVRQYVGFAVMLLSAVLLAAPDLRKLKFSRALPLMLLAAVITAALVLLEKEAYRLAGFWTGYLYVILGMALTGAAIVLARKEGRGFVASPSRWKRYLPFILASEVIGAAGNTIGSYALSLGPASLVQVVKGVQPIFVLLYGVALAPFYPQLVREPWGRHAALKVFLMAAMLAGLWLVS